MSGRGARDRRRSRDDGQQPLRWRRVMRYLTEVILGAAATFLGGLLLRLVVLGPAEPTEVILAPTATYAPATAIAPAASPEGPRAATSTPTRSPTPTSTVRACPSRLDPVRGTPFIYRVLQGDTVLYLSSCFCVPQDELMDANSIRGPTDLLADTYILIPGMNVGGGPDSEASMLTEVERRGILAFNTIVEGLFGQYAGDRDPDFTIGSEAEATQEAWSWVCSVLDSYRPALVLSARSLVHMGPAVADPDFGWQPWQRGAYATVLWLIKVQRNDGSCMELTLYESVHYGLGGASGAPNVTRFASAMNRYPTTVVEPCSAVGSGTQP